ncbi:hypothetical protein [Lacibacter sp. H407]|uniref:hypothetical protein n=1 Tax=Lacibacter sp. H407 TaxID=3133423 RepID=UPI0030BF81DE
MSLTLLEAVQAELGYPPLQKIDPNTQVVKEDDTTPDEHRFSQASIPAVLTALYNYSCSDVGATHILEADPATLWGDKIFADNRTAIVQHIAEYANYTTENVTEKLNTIASCAVGIIWKQELPEDASMHHVKRYMSSQLPHILPYLPAVLQMGELLHNNTLDDRTNKMEGPLSNFIRALGSGFSKEETASEKKN